MATATETKTPNGLENGFSTSKIFIVDPADIEINLAANQRVEGLDETHVERLALSFEDVGQLQPIGIRRRKGEKPVCEYGNHRLAAAMRVNAMRGAANPSDENRFKIKAVFVDATEDDNASFLNNVVENFCRKELNVLDKAMIMTRMAEDMGLDVPKIAQTLGVSDALVRQTLKVNQLDLKTKTMIAEERLPQAVVWELYDLDDDRRKAVLDTAKAMTNGKRLDSSTLRRAKREVADKAGEEIAVSKALRLTDVRKFFEEVAESGGITNNENSANNAKKLAKKVLKWMDGKVGDASLLNTISEVI